jgi:uncharacterized caspase-like protein
MRDIRFLLKTQYVESRALVIGINAYQHATPLSYACNDATDVRDLLVNELGFTANNVTCLLNEQATREAILRAYFRFTKDDVGLDDRIFIFFAGHGHTLTGSRGEIGFLVPHDAELDDYSTFIRWDDLTRNAELVRAKHVLFIMDACYGGLALTRNALPGSTRFLKDMLLRHSRQVLTAGKADETVSDAGGPLAGHSVFTGHLIEALRGKAASEGGVITASGVMAYVYSRVSSDKDSNQTPHYGHFDGDGDFIFRAPGLTELEAPDDKDLDRLVMIPYQEDLRTPEQLVNKAHRVKALLAAEHSTIELHDFLISETRRFLAVTGADAFPVSGPWNQAELVDRLRRYEEATSDLAALLAAVAYWAKPAHLATLQKCLSRSCDRLENTSGLTVWLHLRWYPLILQTYYAGIAAVDAQRYDSLAALFQTPLSTTDRNIQNPTLVEAIGESILELNGTNVWKTIPGHERNYTPLSEYLYKIVQPRLDDLLFLGKNYDSAFDIFEILLALSVADMRLLRDTGAWGPFGRFGWKRHGLSPPFNRLIQQAKEQGSSWPPLKAGLFGGSLERFERVAAEFGQQVARLPWH